MSNKVTLVATAQVAVVSGSPGSITFLANDGFKTASRGSPGAYELSLKHKHDAAKLVINATLNNASSGQIVVAPIGTGDVNGLQVSVFDDTAAPADSSFFISVSHVGHDSHDDDHGHDHDHDDCHDNCGCNCNCNH